ncbi:MAG: hypothetical protein AB1434_09770, partial [Pseudomonadota bacterium]
MPHDLPPAASPTRPHRVRAVWLPLSGALAAAAALTGCAVYPADTVGTVQTYPAPVTTYPGGWVDAPVVQPEPLYVPAAPPPPRYEVIPAMPFAGAIWIAGSWTWRDRWEWTPGRWSRPPAPQYHWVPPAYERRGDRHVWVPGFWSAPGGQFRPPPPDFRRDDRYDRPDRWPRDAAPPRGPAYVPPPPPPQPQRPPQWTPPPPQWQGPQRPLPPQAPMPPGGPYSPGAPFHSPQGQMPQPPGQPPAPPPPMPRGEHR